MVEQSTQERAQAAAEALDAEGATVTARTVQQRARVSMTVAAAVAREWNKQQAAARAVPEVPAQVLARVDAIWREAVEAARAEHEAERDGWAARLASSEEERAGLNEDLERIEAERAEEQSAARAEADELRSHIAALDAELAAQKEAAAEAASAAAAAETRAVDAETRTAAAEGVVAGLREALAALATKSDG
jgi:hypothetical protein